MSNNSSVMRSIADYIAEECPLLDRKKPFYLDHISDKDCYCVNTVPNPSYKKDIIGNKTYTVTFQFSLRVAISDDEERADNVAFLEEFREWIEDQNEHCRFPDLGFNKTVKSLEVIESGYLDEGDEGNITGIYVTQLQLVYKERKV